MVSLTDKGRAIVDAKRARWHALWDERLGHLSEEEVSAAHKVMRTMIQLLDEL